MGRVQWRVSHVRFLRGAPHGIARRFDEIQRLYRCYSLRSRTGSDWKVKIYGIRSITIRPLLVLSGDHLLRRLGYSSSGRQVTGDTSTSVIQLVLLAAMILARWLHKRR